MDIKEKLLWAILPEGLEEWFEVEGYEKDERKFKIVLLEKNILPALPEEYRGKKVINTIIKPIIVDDFAIRGRKGEMLIKRRCWKFEGIEKLLKREIYICAPGTKLEKEFAYFLKELSRE